MSNARAVIVVDENGLPVSFGGGGGGGGGSVTNPGVSGTQAQAVQGITGGVPVPMSATALPLPTGAATAANQASTNAALGAPADAAAASDTASSSIIAFIKRGLQNWTTLLARIPALVSGRIPVDGSGVTQPVSGPLTDAQLRAARVPVNSSIPTSASGTILGLTTNATGTTYTAFASQACVALDIVNNTGTTIEYRRGAAGVAMQIPNGAARMVIGITNANQIDIRRSDTSNTTVTLQAEAFTA